MFIQIKSIWYYNVYIHKLKLSINYYYKWRPHAQYFNMENKRL